MASSVGVTAASALRTSATVWPLGPSMASALVTARRRSAAAQCDRRRICGGRPGKRGRVRRQSGRAIRRRGRRAARLALRARWRRGRRRLRGWRERWDRALCHRCARLRPALGGRPEGRRRAGGNGRGRGRPARCADRYRRIRAGGAPGCPRRGGGAGRGRAGRQRRPRPSRVRGRVAKHCYDNMRWSPWSSTCTPRTSLSASTWTAWWCSGTQGSGPTARC